MLEHVGQRVVIERVSPEIDSGRFPIKRVAGEDVLVRADIFADGHDQVAASLLYKRSGDATWNEAEMRPIGNDRWEGRFSVGPPGFYYYTLQSWVDHFLSWRKDLEKKIEADRDVEVELIIGSDLVGEAAARARGADADRLTELARALRGDGRGSAISDGLGPELEGLMCKYPDRLRATTYGKELGVVVDEGHALFSTWYELFPRSWSSTPGAHGTLRDCERLLAEIARMGFDVLYLPPIHPIGRTNRKGKNNSTVARPGDPGSPWAIGADEGGHKAIEPQLGTLEDFLRLTDAAGKHEIRVAIDLAYQASPDHPYVKAHPEWFKWRPDGQVQYAENPPKKYEDVLPFNFESDNSRELWEELKSVVLFWIENGVRVFRVDNPHTKPIQFWEWLIGEVRQVHPDVLFLSEAFTRPAVMYRLGKIGFAQSYTYFTWRNSKTEITEYLNELINTEVREYFRPSFWPNTPDILPEYLQFGGRPAFMIRLVLAATLSSNYGIYGPAFELLVSEANPGTEEYFNSEKYEIKQWDWNREGNLKDFIAKINRVRRENPALQTTWNLKFYEIQNDYLLAYGKVDDARDNVLLIIVNLDPFHTQSGMVRVPLSELGIDAEKPYLVSDLLSDDRFVWQGEWNRVDLNPRIQPAHVFRLHSRLRRETDFDYFM